MANLPFTEEEYREAARIWKKYNPTKESIPQRRSIRISSGKMVPVGLRLMNMRQNLDRLTEEEKEFWKDYGLFTEYYVPTEKDFREAAIIWKKENPDKDDILRTTIITISNGRQIKLGIKIKNMRQNLDKLTEEQKEFWSNYGLFHKRYYNQKLQEKDFREAAVIWREQNPDKESVPYNEVIILPNGKPVNLGMKIQSLRSRLDELSEERKAFWTPYGLLEGYPTEEDYRNAAIIWRKENPDKEYISRNVVITLPNGKLIKLGERINNINSGKIKLNKEQKLFWEDYCLFYQKEKNNIFFNICQKYQLPTQDKNIFVTILVPFNNTLKEYQKLDVGLEEDKVKKLEKVKEYNLDEYDIEESFFMGIEFKRKVLKLRKDALRMDLLRQYIIDWNYYSEAEKNNEHELQNFSQEELDFINKSREDLDSLIAKCS